jgi:hypothetical protein
MQRRSICFQRAKLYSLCWRRIQRARGKKSVILALRYFSAAAGDALRLLDALIRLEQGMESWRINTDLVPSNAMQQCTLKIDADKHCEQAIFLIHYDL